MMTQMCVRAAATWLAICGAVLPCSGASSLPDVCNAAQSNACLQDDGESLSMLQHKARAAVPEASLREISLVKQPVGPNIVVIPPDQQLHDAFAVNPTTYFNLSNLVVNNLGGQGPDTGVPPEMRYQAIYTLPSGLAIDLVVTALTPYDPSPKSSSGNGLKGKLGAIQFRGSLVVDLKFAFVKTGTNDPVTVRELYFTVYDVDNAKVTSPIREEIFTEHYEYAYLTNDTSVITIPRPSSPTGKPGFQSTVKDASGFNNPTDPATLSAEQRRHTVSFAFFSVSEVVIQMGVPSGSPNNGRKFFFSGVPVLEKCVNDTKTIDMLFNDLAYSNMNEVGPDLTAPEGMRFKKVFTFDDGQSVDMIVKVINTPGYEYQAKVPWKNGIREGYGAINMRRNRKGNFSVEFVDSNTSQPVVVRNLMFSFLDMDGDRTCCFEEAVVVGGFDRAVLTEDTTIAVTNLTDGRTMFSATEPPHKNPHDPAVLTPGQQARGVQLHFPPLSKFFFVIDFTSSTGSGSRNIYFAGKSRLSNAEKLEYCTE